MSNEETKKCEYCGREIPLKAQKCRYCYNWVSDEAISRNHIPNSYNTKENIHPINHINNENFMYKNRENFLNSNKQEFKEKGHITYNHAFPIRRLFLLMITTFGLYSIYWFYNNSKILKENYGKNISVGVRTFIFTFIPIGNWIVFYYLLNDWEDLIESRGIESFSSPANLLIYICIPFLGLWSIINIQESMNDFWRIEDLNLRTKRSFTNTEIIVMIIFSIIWILLIFFILTLIVFI